MNRPAMLQGPSEPSTCVCLSCQQQITYWDAYDGQAIRIVEGSNSAQINTLTTDSAGDALLSGGGDRLVKLWGYDEGVVSACFLLLLPTWQGLLHVLLAYHCQTAMLAICSMLACSILIGTAMDFLASTDQHLTR